MVAPRADVPDQAPHYVQCITDLGENRDVVAREDIYAANGMKLLAKGARINASQCERLKMHKLRAPLDRVLTTDNAVSTAHLVDDANKMFADDAAMRRLAERSGDPRGFRQVLASLKLPPSLAFRLTVMREVRNDPFQHTMRVALITHALAVRLNLSERNKADAVLAALCHDIGEMHTDPALLSPGHIISPEERRFVHVHPITGFVVMQDMGGICSSAQQAVLQHHERMDGSGYPYGLTADKIDPLAKLVGVAEVMEGVVRRANLERFDVLLRLNQHRFDQAVVDALRELLRTDASNAASDPAAHDASAQLRHIASVLAAWPAWSAAYEALGPAAPAYRFLYEQMVRLRSLALQAGIDPNAVEALLEMACEDSRVLNELRATLDELGWLMGDIANEMDRRTAQGDNQSATKATEFTRLLRGA